MLLFKSCSWGRLFFWLMAGCSLGALSPAIAQDRPVSPSQVTPRDFRPRPQTSGAITLPAAAGLTAPEGADKLVVQISRVDIEGNYPEFRDKIAELTAQLIGKKTTVSDIYAVANAIEQAYAVAGYVLVRVVVPPQKLDKGGPLKLAVVDGYVEKVELKGVPETQRALVSSRMAPLIDQRHVLIGEIERRLMLASDIPGIVLRSTLTKGERPGGVILVLEGRHDVLTGTVGIDNHLPTSLGTYSLSASMSLNSRLGFGEQVYLSAASGLDISKTFGDSTAPVKVFAGGVNVPVGNDGIVLNGEYTHSVTQPTPAPNTPNSAGTMDRISLRASYAAIKTYGHSLTLQSNLEFDTQFLNANQFGELYDDKYRVLRLQADDRYQGPLGVLSQATLNVSQGLGGRNAADAAASGIPLSHTGATPYFSKLNLTLKLTKTILDDYQVILTGRAQSTFGQPVFTGEQLSLDNPETLSGWPSGTFSVDEGAAARAEITRSFSWTLEPGQVTLAPYLFGAAGKGVTHQPSNGQLPTTMAQSFGVGVRVGGDVNESPRGATLALEYARTFSNAPGLMQGHRVSLNAGVRF